MTKRGTCNRCQAREIRSRPENAGKHVSRQQAYNMEYYQQLYNFFFVFFFLFKIELPPPDLSPTESLKETMSLLRDVLTSHDASVIPLDARQADYSRVSF